MSLIQGSLHTWIMRQITVVLVLLNKCYIRDVVKKAVICLLIRTTLDGCVYAILSYLINHSISHWLIISHI